METWQEATSRQVKLLTGRLNELLSDGLELLHSELGVDLKPVLIPQWLVLLAACIGLVLMVALWASVCRGLFKKRPTNVNVTTAGDDSIKIKAAVTKPVTKSEEQKKKKKKTDKKTQAAQPNGRAIAESQDQSIVPEETVPPHQAPLPEVKAEKVSELKKSKKKAKQAGKETKATDGKEPEEGTWETKVSNKEKREQRKKDKTSSDGSASPGGADTPKNTPPERPKAAAAPAPAPAPAPAGQRKKRGEPAKVKAEKEPVISQVNSSDGVVSAVLTDTTVKVPSRPAGKTPGHWAAKQEPTSLWGAEIDGSWTVIESGMKTSDLNLVSFSGLGVGAAEPQLMSDLPWLSQPKVEDEWSGLNGGSVDPSSDWNAPSEAWGNYEEMIPQPPALQQEPIIKTAKVNLLIREVDEDEEDKDKIETAADGAAKSKKKKKNKKKKAAEEGAGQENEEPQKDVAEPPVRKQQAVQEAAPAIQPVKAAPVVPRLEKNMKENISQKSPVTQVPQKQTDKEPTAKQNNLPAPTQKKPEESQASKPAKKKKARRET